MNTAIWVLASEGEEHIDRSHSWIWPEGYEIAFGGVASVLIFALLWWKAGPFVRKGLAARTSRIQEELDAATQAKAAAEAESAEIRKAKGDIETERVRVLADADAQAEALLRDGRARLDREVAELEAKADADIAAAELRTSDEMRAEIARLASVATDEVIAAGLDDETHQALIEAYVSGVGATHE
jgi:F-type H+-transporting ATPase subunit b